MGTRGVRGHLVLVSGGVADGAKEVRRDRLAVAKKQVRKRRAPHPRDAAGPLRPVPRHVRLQPEEISDLAVASQALDNVMRAVRHEPNIVTQSDMRQVPKSDYESHSAWALILGMANARSDSEVKVLVGKRLRLSRELLGKSQGELAEAYGFKANRWNQWEQGSRLADLYTMLRFCHDYYFTLDWIYRGRLGSLTVERAEELRKRIPARELRQIAA